MHKHVDLTFPTFPFKHSENENFIRYPDVPQKAYRTRGNATTLALVFTGIAVGRRYCRGQETRDFSKSTYS